MGRKKEPHRLPQTEIEKLIAYETQLPLKHVQRILRSYYHVVREALLSGYSVGMTNVGRFTHTTIKSKPERMWYSPLEKKEILIPATEAFNRVLFKPTKSLTIEMKRNTQGNLFDDGKRINT